MDEVFNLYADHSKYAESLAREQCKNGNTSMVAAISALYALWNFFHLQQALDPASKSTNSPTNLVVANHLTWLCNTAIAIRKLAFTGFEPQARVLARTFIEAIYQTLVIFSDHESYLLYQHGIDSKSSKKAYYEVFSKKQKLQKKLQKLEDSIVTNNYTTERDEQYFQRLGMLEFYSQATHSSALHVFKSALQADNESKLKPIILGGFSLDTENTLLNCSHEICYFCILFDHIIKNIWIIEDVQDNYHYRLFSQLFELAVKFRTYQLQDKL